MRKSNPNQLDLFEVPPPVNTARDQRVRKRAATLSAYYSKRILEEIDRVAEQKRAS